MIDNKCCDKRDRTVHISSCCDADLIYYNIEEDSFYGNEGDLLITKEGIDKIESIYRITTSNDFKAQRKETTW